MSTCSSKFRLPSDTKARIDMLTELLARREDESSVASGSQEAVAGEDSAASSVEE